MKKALAFIALTIVSAGVIFGLSFLCLWAVLILSVFGVLLGIIAVAGLGFAHAALRGVFEKKAGLSWWKYVLWAYAPSMLGSAVYCIVVRELDKAGYFKGLFAGLGEFLIGLAWLITSAAALVAGSIIILIFSRWRKRKEQL